MINKYSVTFTRKNFSGSSTRVEIVSAENAAAAEKKADTEFYSYFSEGYRITKVAQKGS
jgi:hypothetical protein